MYLPASFESDELAAAWQRDRFVKRSFPAVCRLTGQCRFSLQPIGGAVRPFRALLVAALQPCLSGAVMLPHEHEVS